MALALGEVVEAGAILAVIVLNAVDWILIATGSLLPVAVVESVKRARRLRLKSQGAEVLLRG